LNITRLNIFPIRRHLVYDDELRLKGRPVLGVDCPSNTNICTHSVFRADLSPPRGEMWAIHRHSPARDSNKAPTWLEALEGLLDVFRGGINQLLTLDPVSGPRERRIHHNHVRLDALGENVVKLLGVFGIDFMRDRAYQGGTTL
jgi:hypothetical protein